MVTDRGQAHTLEALTAALLLIGSIVFALQVTAVTPLTASTSSQHIENQQLQVARGLLDAAVRNGSLREAVLHWNNSRGEFYRASDEGYYVVGGPGTTFGAMLNRTFRDRGIAFNVNIIYVRANGELDEEQMVHFGSPSDHAVSARRTLTLYDDDRIPSFPGSASTTVNSSTTYFAPQAAPDSSVYNVLRVEVVVWRM